MYTLKKEDYAENIYSFIILYISYYSVIQCVSQTLQLNGCAYAHTRMRSIAVVAQGNSCRVSNAKVHA